MRQHGLLFPVVLKPDAGQRGSGVSIVRSSRKLREYLTHAAFPVILQEYVSGEEYGVFYYRYPGDERGRILSVTEKRMPILVGDGKRTLEELILAEHPYDTPEFIALKPDAGNSRYLRWLSASVSPVRKSASR